MCGICGIIKANSKVKNDEIDTLTSALSHRGPDGEGKWIHGNVAIGHRRLALIDVAGGKQPIFNEDETIAITFNGEIYNYLDLRKVLISKGHKFKTNSDTEVIVHGYEEWGDTCVEKFRGMFAFAIVDCNKKRVFIARDHLGIKPIVYYHDRNCFVFASEIQAIKSLNYIDTTIDYKAIDQYLWLQYIPAPLTAFKRIFKLKPGHRMSVSFDGTVKEPEQYWDLKFKPDNSKNETEWLEELDSLLKESVKLHLQAEVPFGAFLSGGIDSSLIVGYMSEILSNPVKTFSIGFKEEDYNELDYAKIVAKKCKTEHHFEIIKPNKLEILPDLVKHYGEPFGDSSSIPTYYVSKYARENVTMVLSGDGGDELFAGYESYMNWNSYLSLPKYKLLGNITSKFSGRSSLGFLYKNDITLASWVGHLTYINNPLRSSLWKDEYKENINNELEVFNKEYSKTNRLGITNKAQYMDIKTYLPYDILTKVDIASMMSSLEVRTPIVDKVIAEFAATIPTKYNLERKDNNIFEGKLLLKKLLNRKYSKKFVYRKKKGFAMPVQKWFSRNGDKNKFINERLLDKDSRIMQLFNRNAVEDVINSEASGPIWLLLFLEEWLGQNNVS